jgi:FtsH-binding integral membrane protein
MSELLMKGVTMSVTQPPGQSPTTSLGTVKQTTSLTSNPTTSADQPVRTLGPTADVALSGARTVFGQVMGLVALTVGSTALGAYVGRDLSGGAGLLFFIGALGCIFGLNVASSRGREQLAIGFLLGLGLLLGLAVAPVIAAYANADPAALWQAAGATAAFVAALGAFGYATRRDLSRWARVFFWALVGLIAVGIALIFVSIPNANVIYAVAGLVIFGGFTVIDFNRIRRSGVEDPVPLAAGIFLDVFNVFLLMLELFGGEKR